MRHLTTEELIDYLEKNSIPDQAAAISGHLETCSACMGQKKEFESLLRKFRQDRSFEPRAELVSEAIDLFQPILRVNSDGLPVLIASLIRDSFQQALTAGVRNVAAPPRQLLFRAGRVDIDVRIEASDSNNRITLLGQVLSDGSKFFDNAPVKLESHRVVRYRTRTNVVGEFSFDDVPKDDYHLTVELPDGTITVLCVDRDKS